MFEKNEHVVKETFTLLANDVERLQKIKIKILQLGIATNKSELIRMGIAFLDQLSEQQLTKMLQSLPKVKVGRKKVQKS